MILAGNELQRWLNIKGHNMDCDQIKQSTMIDGFVILKHENLFEIIKT